MGSKRINAEFKEFLSEKFKDVKSDLFSAFMVRTFQLALPETYIGFVTPFVWMFLSSYEKIRITLIKEKTIYNLVKPSYTSFFDSAIAVMGDRLCSSAADTDGAVADQNQSALYDLR
jgi:hypothetical protein